VPSGSVSSRPPVRRSNPLFGIQLSNTRPAVSLPSQQSQAVPMPPYRTQHSPMFTYRGASSAPELPPGVYDSQLRTDTPHVSTGFHSFSTSAGISDPVCHYRAP
jgi:hypothetical protein